MRNRFRRRQRDAVPHQPALRERHQQRALTDRKAWLKREAGQAEIVAPDHAVTFRERLAREESLSVPADVLPFVLANLTGRVWIFTIRELRAAGFAGPEGHAVLPTETIQLQ